MKDGIKIGLMGDWKKASRILAVAPLQIRTAIDKAVLQEAQYFRTKVVEGFRTQAPGGKPFKPLSENTLGFRKLSGNSGSKALVVSGDLRNSIKVVKKSTILGAEAFVGVHRNARGRDGRSLINIAEVHEFGSRVIIIEITEAMRKFLMASFSKMRGSSETSEGSGSGGISRGFIITQIPARPFLRPVIDAYFGSAESAARFQARVATNLQGMLGITSIVPGVRTSSSGKSLFSTIGGALQRSRKAQ